VKEGNGEGVKEGNGEWGERERILGTIFASKYVSIKRNSNGKR